jgi:putative autotransporter adhesin-like protein
MSPKLLVLLAAFVLVACDGAGSATCTSDCITVNDGGTLIHGSGKLKTETRPVAPFTAIRLASPATVVIERTGTETLTVTGDDNLLSLFTSDVRDGTLSLATARGKSFEGKIPVYRITVRDLRKVDLTGSGTLSASGLEGDALSISVSGSGTLDVAGRVNDLAVSVSGSGTVDASQLMAKRGKVVVSGSGDLTVNASDELDARVTGSGSITYAGSPKLNSAVSGSGSIEKK